MYASSESTQASETTNVTIIMTRARRKASMYNNCIEFIREIHLATKKKWM
ncbi:hypothetical protein HanPI659440_Chr17g0663741 [Helianthus annuus]|nr:hypothetical protein HanPI659440_Chr17g0663741 [Helianthus annuus]